MFFVLFTFLMYLALLVFWGSSMQDKYHKNLKYKQGLTGFMHTRLQEADTTKNIDLLFLGSSHAYRGFDPRIFNALHYKCFNFGSSNQTPIQTELLLKQYVRRFKPKLVIYEVFPGNFEMDGVESAVDIISNTSHYGNAFLYALAVNHVMVYNTCTYAAMRKMFWQDLAFREEKIVGVDTYVEGGFVERSKLFERQVEELGTGLQWNLKPKQLKAFERSLEVLKEENIPYLLVQSPVAKSYFKQYENYAYTDSLFATKGNYINFNYIDSMQYNDETDFYDGHHLSIEGVKKFNASLLNQLQKIPYNK